MSRPNGVFKTENDYQKLIPGITYDKTPKAVFAALAVSYMLNYAGIEVENIDAELKKEWDILNKNGIVPQKAIK